MYNFFFSKEKSFYGMCLNILVVCCLLVGRLEGCKEDID